MKINRIKIISIFIIIFGIFLMGTCTFAHSGRTDSSGGHRDNKNKSGLGSYHYHCGGYPAHLHTNGVCPYTSSSSSSKSNTSAESSSSNIKTSTTKLSTIEVTEIEINEEVESLEIGNTKKVTATITPSTATNKEITWKSSDTNVAVVTTEGEIIAKGVGMARITAISSNGKTSTIEINVKDIPEIEDNATINTKISSVNNVENTKNNDSEDQSLAGGIMAVALFGSGAYLAYRNYRKSK